MAETETNAEVLFAQAAQGTPSDATTSRLPLTGASPATPFFTDRTERIAGNMSTARFVPSWSDGADSFLPDPSSADLPMIVDGPLRQTATVLT
jgi:hypothetical protein